MLVAPLCWSCGEVARRGEPLCPRCYQAAAQVLWNALAGRLWSRTTIYVYRALAQLAGLTEGELRRLVRVSFAKVAEYQKRGRSTSTPSSAWTPPPTAPARTVSGRHRRSSPPPSSRRPSRTLPRQWPWPARLSRTRA